MRARGGGERDREGERERGTKVAREKGERRVGMLSVKGLDANP